MSMDINDMVLDLTGLNNATFLGEIRVRHILDWAEDYFKNRKRLSQVKFRNDQYRLFMRELEKDDYLIGIDKFTKELYMVGPYGPIVIINSDKK